MGSCFSSSQSTTKGKSFHKEGRKKKGKGKSRRSQPAAHNGSLGGKGENTKAAEAQAFFGVVSENPHHDDKTVTLASSEKKNSRRSRRRKSKNSDTDDGSSSPETTNPLTPHDKIDSDCEEVSVFLHSESTNRNEYFLMENRQWQMLLHDFRTGMPRPPPLLLAPDFDDDDGARKCSMTPAAIVGARKAAEGFSPLRRTPKETSDSKDIHLPTARANVQNHDSEEDMWVVIRNKVYNLTPFVAGHPGGSWVLLQAAGQDATQLFEQQHNPQYLVHLRDHYVGDVPDDERR